MGNNCPTSLSLLCHENSVQLFQDNNCCDGYEKDILIDADIDEALNLHTKS